MLEEDLLREWVGEQAALYPYQKKVCRVLRAGKHAVVHAPTGAGKTWAVLLPFVAAHRQGKRFADRVLYALPMRTLAYQLWKSTAEMCEKVAPDLRVTLQTGEHREDVYFEGDICFTTIDQLLSSYLMMPVSLSPALDNINAGVLLGALVIFDEVHLFDPERAWKTVIEMTGRLKNVTQFVLMTATLTKESLERLHRHLGGEWIAVSEEELAMMPSHRDKERRWHWVSRPLTAEDVLARHRGGRSLVICNTVTRAQELYKELDSRLSEEKAGSGEDGRPELFLLHSRFLREDRAAVEARLRPYFGPDAVQSNAILISTQVVEAGVDISADVEHTELAPANALIQRGGRSARYKPPRHRSDVYVYELPVNERGESKAGPYRTRTELQWLERTRAYLEARSGEIFSFIDENAWLQEVHREETEVLQAQIKRILGLTKSVGEVMTDGERSALAKWVREIHHIQVAVTDHPEEIDFDQRPELFSIPVTALFGLLGDRFGETTGTDSEHLYVWVPREGKEEESGIRLDWQKSPLTKEVITQAWLLALPPHMAQYDCRVGLEIGVQGNEIPIHYFGKRTVPRSLYKGETFRDHVDRVVSEVRAHVARHPVGSRKLAEVMEADFGAMPWSVEDLCVWAAVFHDAGKLSAEWQSAMRGWMERFFPDDPAHRTGLPLAHGRKKQPIGNG
ncbi:MAG TPA: CRISPR-associated helicase Cas3' [Alicyclobacillus sp.]|nr:CRISPR-associated helicase Cas3' [Alicyclobacillus sp.]